MRHTYTPYPVRLDHWPFGLCHDHHDEMRMSKVQKNCRKSKQCTHSTFGDDSLLSLARVPCSKFLPLRAPSNLPPRPPCEGREGTC